MLLLMVTLITQQVANAVNRGDENRSFLGRAMTN